MEAQFQTLSNIAWNKFNNKGHKKIPVIMNGDFFLLGLFEFINRVFIEEVMRATTFTLHINAAFMLF